MPIEVSDNRIFNLSVRIDLLFLFFFGGKFEAESEKFKDQRRIFAKFLYLLFCFDVNLLTIRKTYAV